MPPGNMLDGQDHRMIVQIATNKKVNIVYQKYLWALVAKVPLLLLAKPCAFQNSSYFYEVN